MNNSDVIITALRPIKVFNTDALSVGSKIYYRCRDSYSNVDDWGICYDEGYGIVQDISANRVLIKYNGYAMGILVDLDIEDIESGFHKIDIL